MVLDVLVDGYAGRECNPLFYFLSLEVLGCLTAHILSFSEMRIRQRIL